MAKKKEESSKIVLERNYVIPLRRETLKVPNFKKANKAIRTIKKFISKHMKSETVAVGKHLNLFVWKHGAKNPPHKVQVTASKDDKGRVFVEIVGAPKEEPKSEEKKPAKKEEKVKGEKPEEKLGAEAKEIKEEKAEEAKKVEHEEIRELKKEQHEHISGHHPPKMPQKTKFQEQHQTAPKSL